MRGGYRRGKAIKPVIVAGTPSIYLLRDQFLTDFPAGSLDETISEPVVGIRRVTDAEDKIFITLDRLRGGGQDTPVWGQSKMVWVNTQYGGYARVTGRTLVGLLLPEDTIVSADIAFGFASAVNIGDPRTDGLGFLTEDGGEIDIIVPGIKIKLRGDDQRGLRPMQYLIGITLNDIGAVWWISTFGTQSSAVGNMTNSTIPKYPLAGILWIDRTNTTATLFPYIQYFGKIMAPLSGYPNGNSLEDVRLMDIASWAAADAFATFSDRFTRADSNTTPGNSWTPSANSVWGISGNKLYFVSRTTAIQHFCNHDTGLVNGNGIFYWEWTKPSIGLPCFFLYYRMSDADNWYRITNHGGGENNLYIQRRLAGVQTDTWAKPDGYTWVNGQTYRFHVIADGNRMVLTVDDVVVFNTASAALNELLTSTKMGVGEWSAPIVDERWDNVAAYPLQTTLPAVFDLGKIPTILIGGTIIAQDHFTGINGTLLSAHAPDVGPAWVHPVTNWTIQGNKADPVLHVSDTTWCVQDLGVTDCECQVTITLAAGCDRAFPGIVGRYVDTTHFIGARICWADYAPTGHEVEFLSNAGVLHKVNLGTYYTAGSTHTLKMQFKGDLIQVFLDGEPVISYYTTAADPVGTKFGLQDDYLTRSQEGHVFEDWIVRSL